jgi:hypothetical protein
MPESLEIADAADERTRWRNLLERHVGALSGQDEVDPSDPKQRMMALLARYRQLQDEVMARHISQSSE